MKLPVEEFDRRLAEDLAHKMSRDGHELQKQFGMPSGMPCERKVCSCGWKGEWVRVR